MPGGRRPFHFTFYSMQCYYIIGILGPPLCSGAKTLQKYTTPMSMPDEEVLALPTLCERIWHSMKLGPMYINYYISAHLTLLAASWFLARCQLFALEGLPTRLIYSADGFGTGAGRFRFSKILLWHLLGNGGHRCQMK